MRIVLLDSFAADQGEPAPWAELAALGELVTYTHTKDAEVIARCAGAGAVLTNKVPIGAPVMAAEPALRYIGVVATGTNMVDLPAARARGIAVTNVPGYATDSAAQLVFALVLHFTHDVAGHSADVKAGRWAASPDFCFFRQPLVELAGKTLAVVGSGHIGGAVARIGEAFGMRVLRAAVPGSPSINRVPLLEAVAAADVVSLHCPLTPATQSLVNATFLAAMRPDAILINTGRGGLVDDGALLAALQAGRLRGVGLDVLQVEPPPADHPLTNPRAPWAARVAVTPHIAWGTVEARRRIRAEVAKNLQAFLDGATRNRVV
ncbi:MAG TPA: D-2-hydroxyacid dehydrogenase [Polyangia bacterium]|nr:D-2-hydroxyacid dehydrogenase [Polyangia bacterium]